MRNARPATKTHSWKTAAVAGLQYASDAEPGIRRRRHGSRFRFVGARGKPIRDKRILSRIRALAIPPAWTDVWICSRANGHLQATGFDARHRKQYLYHSKWRSVRDSNKFERLLDFAQALPKIRRRLKRDLSRRGLPREKVLATVVKLLETSLARVGNEEYARHNGSFGLTTMRDRHAKVRGARIRLDFRGKAGIHHTLEVCHPRLAGIVQQCQELPGQQLFQYLDPQGHVCRVGSRDVNDYLREIGGQAFTAKDFRTWAGTVLAAEALQEFEDVNSGAAAKRVVSQAIKQVAQRLGNTSAICRKCYVHPAVIDAYLEHSLAQSLQSAGGNGARNSPAQLDAREREVLALLRQRTR